MQRSKLCPLNYRKCNPVQHCVVILFMLCYCLFPLFVSKIDRLITIKVNLIDILALIVLIMDLDIGHCPFQYNLKLHSNI